MRALVVGLTAGMLAACGASTPAPGEHLTGSASDVPHRATPPPEIIFAANAFATPMLPAVARAGEIVVVPVIERDGERGLANLRIEVRDKADKTIQTIPVMTSNEMDKQPNDAAARIATANTELRRLHDLHDLVAMQPLDIQPPAGGGPTHLAMGDGLDVDWGGDHLHVFRHNSDRAVLIREARMWQTPAVDSKTSGMCDYVSYLKAAFHAPEIPVVVVELGFRSDRDVCREPSDQQHVATW